LPNKSQTLRNRYDPKIGIDWLELFIYLVKKKEVKVQRK